MGKVQGEVSSYYIDFTPSKKNELRYLEIKQFFLENYLDVYQEKIIAILLKLMTYYNFRMYLTDFPYKMDGKKEKEYAALVGTDLCSLSIEEWSSIVRFVIKENISSIQILSNNPRFLISINGNFSNELLRIPKEQVNFIKSIIESEGLYLVLLKE